jgi:hypothetical protein
VTPRAALAVALAMATGLALTPTRATAATAYVTDELVLGLYAEQTGQGQRLATLHSGATLETLAVSGEFTQVRLSDGTVGWVKSTYLTTREPATARLKELEEELERNHATTPELAEAAARSEVDRLKRALAAKQSELDAARGATAPPPGAARTAAAAGDTTPPTGTSPGAASRDSNSPGDDATHAAEAAGAAGAAGAGAVAPPSSLRRLAPVIAAAVVSLAVGFWMGHATLARRIRRKFGGIKVY